MMSENEISYKVRGAVFNVYNKLGPGLLESAYQTALEWELRKAGLQYQSQVGLPMNYEGVLLDIGYRIDVIVEGKVLLELKSLEAILEVHHKQVLTYLKLSGLKLGLLINFNTVDISKSIFRKIMGRLEDSQ